MYKFNFSLLKVVNPKQMGCVLVQIFKPGKHHWDSRFLNSVCVIHVLLPTNLDQSRNNALGAYGSRSGENGRCF